METLYKNAVAAAFVLLASSSAHSDEADLMVARELAELRTALQELESTANQNARYVLPLRTNMQLSRLSVECASSMDQNSQHNSICAPLPVEADTDGVAGEIPVF